MQFRSFIFDEHRRKVIVAKYGNTAETYPGSQSITKRINIKVIVGFIPVFTAICFVNYFCMRTQLQTGYQAHRNKYSFISVCAWELELEKQGNTYKCNRQFTFY